MGKLRGFCGAGWWTPDELFDGDEAAPFYWTTYTAARVLSGASPGEPLEELVAEISPTPLLLIATGRDLPAERDFNRVYAEAAREPVELG